MKLPVNYNKTHWIERKKVREEYMRRQNDLCCYCGKPLSGKPDIDVKQKPVNKYLFPQGFFDYPVHLHHDHNTGMTVGAVHNYCNAVLWQYDGE